MVRRSVSTVPLRTHGVPTVDAIMTDASGLPPMRTSSDTAGPSFDGPLHVEQMIQTESTPVEIISHRPPHPEDRRCSECKLSISSDSSSSSDVMEISDGEDDGTDEIVGGL